MKDFSLLRSGLVAAAAAVGLLAASPADASAQYVWGNVLDAETGRPVSAAEIVVMNNRREVVGRTTSAGDGRFSVSLRSAGFHYVTVSRLGYADHDPVAFFVADEGDMALDLKLRAEAIDLPGLQVTLTSLIPHLEYQGFYHRRNRRPGAFLEREDFEKLAPTRSSEILRRVAGIRVVREEGGVAEPVMRGGTGMDQSCKPGVVLDGFYVRRSGGWGAPVPFDDLVVPSQIEAIEVYKGPATIPPQWRRQSNCGVIVVWTRRG